MACCRDGEAGGRGQPTGRDETYTVLDRGSKLQGAHSALFGKMWDHPPLSEIVQVHNRFMLIATSIKAVYDYTARKMELPARLVVAQDGKHVHVKHNCDDSPTYLQQHQPRRRQSANVHCIAAYLHLVLLDLHRLGSQHLARRLRQ